MRIVQLLAENVKKLSVVEITPQGDLVQITGANASGKSSVLDAIWWALAGTKHIQAQPIRKGADSARIRLDLGELIVTRRFTAAGSTIVVENGDGARYPSPQRMLDELVGALSFDPLEFTRMESRRQFEALRSVVKIDVDIDALDQANAADFAKRTDVNRETKRLRATLSTFPPFAEDLPEEAADTAALVDEIARAGEHNADIERRKERRQHVATDIATDRIVAQAARERAAKLRREAEEAETEAKARDARADDLQKKLDEAPPLPEPIDAAAVRSRLETAQKINAEIERRARFRRVEKEAADGEAAASTLTEAMNVRLAEKEKAIGAAQMPVDGLGLGDGVVLFGGIPLEQASSAEQLRVSCALAMAANPKLRVLRIKDGSLLDENGLRLLAEMAAAHDYQIWLERVDTSGKVGVVLEDGRIAGAEPKPEVAQVEAAE